MSDRDVGGTAASRVLVALLALQGLSGLAGGLGLVVDPSGEAIGLPLEWLQGSPFGDYLVPGLVLFTLLGIAPLVVASGLRRARPWAPDGALLVGIALITWIGVQVLVVGYRAEPPLQAVYGLLGVLIAVLAALPSARDSAGSGR